jgi:hypothetical protein
MKVEGEKLFFYLAAHWKRRKIQGFGRRRVDKGLAFSGGYFPVICPVCQTGSTVTVWSSSGRSMRGGAMKSDINSPMKPKILPSEAQRAIFLRLRWSRPRMTCHLSLNRLWLDGIRSCVEDQT